MKCLNCKGEVTHNQCIKCGVDQEAYMEQNIQKYNLSDILKFVFKDAKYDYAPTIIIPVLTKLLKNYPKKLETFSLIYKEDTVSNLQSLKSRKELKRYIQKEVDYYSLYYSVDKNIISKCLLSIVKQVNKDVYYNKKQKSYYIPLLFTLLIFGVLSVYIVSHAHIRVYEEVNEDQFVEAENELQDELTEIKQDYGVKQNVIVQRDGIPKIINIVDYDYDGDFDVLTTTLDSNDIIVYNKQESDYIIRKLNNKVEPIINNKLDMETVVSSSLTTNEQNGLVHLYTSYNNKILSLFSDHDVVNIVGNTGFQASTLCDIDNDYDIDIIASMSSGEIIIYENDNSQYTSRLVDESKLNVVKLNCVDMDGDNDLDILTSSWTNGMIFWYENNNSSFTLRTINANTNVWEVSYVDLNKDGYMDVLTTDVNRIIIYENKNSDFTKLLVSEFSSKVNYIKPVDYDNDDDIDFVVATKDKVFLLRNERYLNFTKEELLTIKDVNFIEVLDIDKDGDLDIVTSDEYGGVYWFGDYNYTLTLKNYDNELLLIDKITHNSIPDEIPIATKDGYLSIGWTDGYSIYKRNLTDFKMPNRDITLVAMYD